MLFGPKEEDQEKNDYFDSTDIPEEKPAPPKKPTYKPDDPDYWEEEPEWDHLKPKRKFALGLWIAAVFVFLGLIVGCWMRYFQPYVTDASQYGYVESMEKRGQFFVTYEGVLIPYKDIMDTTRIYSRDFIFTAKNDSVAARLKMAQLAGEPVRVEYMKYHATLPWRGATKIIVTKVDSVDPAKILPPEFAPRR